MVAPESGMHVSLPLAPTWSWASAMHTFLQHAVLSFAVDLFALQMSPVTKVEVALAACLQV